MTARAHSRRPHAHARGQAPHTEAARLEHGREEAVVLEAVTAPPSRYQLPAEALHVQPRRPPPQHVEIFERDVRRVRQVQRVQHFERRPELALITRARGIRRQI
jgi:hypothetical protein